MSLRALRLFVVVGVVIGVANVRGVSGQGIPQASMDKCSNDVTRMKLLEDDIGGRAYNMYAIAKRSEQLNAADIAAAYNQRNLHAAAEAEAKHKQSFSAVRRARAKLLNAFRSRIAEMYTDIRRKRRHAATEPKDIDDLHACFYIERMKYVLPNNQPRTAEHTAYVQWSLLPPHNRPSFADWIKGNRRRRRTFAKTVLPSWVYNRYHDSRVQRGLDRWVVSQSDDTAPWAAAYKN